VPFYALNPTAAMGILIPPPFSNLLTFEPHNPAHFCIDVWEKNIS